MKQSKDWVKQMRSAWSSGGHHNSICNLCTLIIPKNRVDLKASVLVKLLWEKPNLWVDIDYFLKQNLSTGCNHHKCIPKMDRLTAEFEWCIAMCDVLSLNEKQKRTMCVCCNSLNSSTAIWRQGQTTCRWVKQQQPAVIHPNLLHVTGKQCLGPYKTQQKYLETYGWNMLNI